MRLKYRIPFRCLSRRPGQHDGFLRGNPKIPRRLQWASDIWIFRAAIEGNELHAMRALHLIAAAESSRPFAERLAAFGTEDLDSVGHAVLPQGDDLPAVRIPLIRHVNLDTFSIVVLIRYFARTDYSCPRTKFEQYFARKHVTPSPARLRG